MWSLVLGSKAVVVDSQSQAAILGLGMITSRRSLFSLTFSYCDMYLEEHGGTRGQPLFFTGVMFVFHLLLFTRIRVWYSMSHTVGRQAGSCTCGGCRAVLYSEVTFTFEVVSYVLLQMRWVILVGQKRRENSFWLVGVS